MLETDTAGLSAAVLGRLLLMQSVLCNLPTEESIFSFVCRGLRDLPGVSEAQFARERDGTNATWFTLTLNTDNACHGELHLELSDHTAFAPYEPYLRNFAFMVAVILEERQQRRLNEEQQARLEQRVETRTQQLSQEVAERRAIEEQLRRSRKMLAHTLDSIPQAVFWKDLHGVYLGCNRVFAETVGFEDPMQIVGLTDFDLPWPRHEAETYRRDDHDVIRTGHPKRHITEQVQRFDGTRLWVDTSKVPLTDELGHVFGVLGVYDDISDRLHAEAEQQRLREQLFQAQKMESIGRLAGGVAHDFNNMLQAIIGYADLAQEQLDSPTEAMDSLQEILKAANRSAELTGQLLAFARKQAVSPRVLDLNEALTGTLRLLQRLIGDDIQLVWRPAPRLWHVRIDPIQVHQILANLTINARDAMRDGGQIVIETDNIQWATDSERLPADASPGDYVTLTIRDTGIGMPPDVLEHLFEPFFTTKSTGGTGLGLATVYGIVKQNNGYIVVTSKPGSGSTITVGLPRCTSPLDTQSSPILARQRGGLGTVLLVEDEEQILELGQRILEKHGYSVLTARVPELALQIVAEYRADIDLMITDIVMPGLNGRELASRAKAIRSNMRCLYVSGYTADVLAGNATLEEHVDFLHKPFSVDELLRKVQAILERDSSTR